LLLFIVFD